jgi:hypothetical protein
MIEVDDTLELEGRVVERIGPHFQVDIVIPDTGQLLGTTFVHDSELMPSRGWMDEEAA